MESERNVSFCVCREWRKEEKPERKEEAREREREMFGDDARSTLSVGRVTATVIEKKGVS